MPLHPSTRASGSPRPRATLVTVLAGMGDRTRARQVLDEIDGRDHPFARGLGHLALADEEAVDVLARVEVISAWPAIVLHHFHRELWATLDSTAHDRLLEVARRSWCMPKGAREPSGVRPR